MLKTSAKDLLFLHILCFLAMDDKVGAKKAIQESSIDDANFDGSQEHNFCTEVIKCIEESQADRT